MKNYNVNIMKEDNKGPKYTYVSDSKYTDNEEKVDEDQDMASVPDNVGLASEVNENNGFSFAFDNEDEKEEAESDEMILQTLQDKLLATEEKAFEQEIKTTIMDKNMPA